ncbi:hypothetical protein DMENIID0001_106580 [Sergentomyia squamirostris]
MLFLYPHTTYTVYHHMRDVNQDCVSSSSFSPSDSLVDSEGGNYWQEKWGGEFNAVLLKKLKKKKKKDFTINAAWSESCDINFLRRTLFNPT